jgi:methylaspartate ammonia-lyase
MGENDRELLELAAKAIGEHVTCAAMDLGCGDGVLLEGKQEAWSPLTDDGDALRLAVKLQLTVTSGVARVPSGDFTAIEYSDNGSRDELALTRRAIVRAAADLTKESP